jgi:hypothetical protein
MYISFEFFIEFSSKFFIIHKSNNNIVIKYIVTVAERAKTIIEWELLRGEGERGKDRDAKNRSF